VRIKRLRRGTRCAVKRYLLSLFLSLSREDFDEREPPQKREELSTGVLRAKKEGSFSKKKEKKKKKNLF